MLEERGHKFVRYADDCNIYVKSRRAAERVSGTEVRGELYEVSRREIEAESDRKKSATGSPLKPKFSEYEYIRNP
jgi:hypothetical protein